MRILITGITGFAGPHLARELLAQEGVELFGLGLRGSSPTDLQGQVHLFHLDLSSTRHVEDLLRDVQPEHIYHLAGYADAGRSHQEPDAAWAGNLTATRSLYDAVLRWGGKPRVLYVSSGMIYGESTEPLREQSELRPASPYAASKAAADLLSYQYYRTHNLDIVRARPFNHFGPGQSPQYAVANFARQLAAIELGRQPPVLRTGNLWAERDLTDVRDVVGAYRLLLKHGQAGEAYNIASGRTQPMQAVLDRLLTLCSVRMTVETAAELVRPVETATVGVETGKLWRATAWTPRYSLEQTLADTLAYWRRRLAAEEDHAA